MLHLNEANKTLDNIHNVIVGYTNFGYRKSFYKSIRNWTKRDTIKNYYLENWIGNNNLEYLINDIKQWMTDYNIASVTIGELHKVYKQNQTASEFSRIIGQVSGDKAVKSK